MNQNNIATQSKSELWLETMKDGCNKVNQMFDLNIEVDLRFREQLEQMSDTVESAGDENDSEK